MARSVQVEPAQVNEAFAIQDLLLALFVYPLKIFNRYTKKRTLRKKLCIDMMRYTVYAFNVHCCLTSRKSKS